MFDTVFPPGYDSGAFRSSDLPFLFDMDESHSTLDEPRRRLSADMIDYWTGFAATGDPNTSGPVTWPRFDDGTAPALARGDIGVVDQSGRHHCGFWAGLDA